MSYISILNIALLLDCKDYTLSTTTENELHSASLASRRIELTVELDGFGKLTGMAIFDPGLQKKQKGTYMYLYFAISPPKTISC